MIIAFLFIYVEISPFHTKTSLEVQFAIVLNTQFIQKSNLLIQQLLLVKLKLTLKIVWNEDQGEYFIHIMWRMLEDIFNYQSSMNCHIQEQNYMLCLTYFYQEFSYLLYHIKETH